MLLDTIYSFLYSKLDSHFNRTGTLHDCYAPTSPASCTPHALLVLDQWLRQPVIDDRWSVHRRASRV